MSVIENNHQLLGLPTPVPVPAALHIRSCHLTMTMSLQQAQNSQKNHLLLHSFGLGAVEILQIPSQFTEFVTRLLPTALQSRNLRATISTMKCKLNIIPGWRLWVLLENLWAQLPSFAGSLAINYIYRNVITLLKSRKALLFL